MKFRLLLAAAFAALAAGCTSYCTPTVNTGVVTLSDGTQGYRVMRQGLFESSNACLAQAQKICRDRQPMRVMSAEHAADGFKPNGDPRELTFICGTPRAAQQPAAQPAPAMASVPAPAPVVRKVTLQGDANFATGSAVLTPAAKSSLNQFVQGEQGVKLQRLAITGHTDSTGSATLNQHLPQARAASVQNYLMSQGVTAQQYDVSGMGSAQPVASNATAEGRSQNRRVEIQAVGQQ
ncbi:OmpA family protein [Paraburkholderia phosphatilytica]|uniref:OmpA family protein n=1 Tax=Paraburkholderia phosphatilytica TaxID=2282883 RepID=UPI000E4CE75F|nr:OmpA family protein [Paraburkholderia phosphatilytica]